MRCTHCESPIEKELPSFPFERSELLSREPHEVLHLHQCTQCGARYVGISVDAFDDTLSYWVKASDAEIAVVKSWRHDTDFANKVVKLIQGKDAHIFGSYDGRYYFKRSCANVLIGKPPW